MADAEAELRRKIIAICTDTTLTEAEKAQKRQQLLSGKWQQPDVKDDTKANASGSNDNEDRPESCKEKETKTMFDESLQCTMCMELCNRPVTAPCQHNFCLSCFNKWINQGKKTCPTCRHAIPAKFAANPRINTALACAIRMAKQGVSQPNANKAFERIQDKDRPDEAFTTERAQRAGRANAASGRIMVTVPGDWFGPIPPENDPRGQGVLVGEFWKDRLDCRQWGAHFPHVAGIAGQSNNGAQSVVLSGGYEDDLDEGEWFLYTGSGGRDLSGNKRVNSVQSFDQTFDKMNKALQVSCEKGLPVRVVRSHKEKRSSYAPTEEQPVRYDGIYRIVRAYRKPGAQGKLVCRYLFVRADNAAAPWSSEDVGDRAWDRKVPKPALDEIKLAKGKVYEMTEKPWWDYDAEKEAWGWSRPAPVSQKMGGDGTSENKTARKKISEHEKALREFQCKLCSKTLNQPLSTPCGHHFCKPCLEKLFEGKGVIEKRGNNSGRPLRELKVVKPCPTCKADIAEFLANAQVNRGMTDAIEKLQAAIAKAAEDKKAEQDSQTAADVALPAAEEPLPVAEPQAAQAAGEPVEPAAEDPGADAPASSDAIAVAPDAPVPEPVPAAQAANQRDTDLDALCEEFPQFDRGLLEGMLEDQGGDAEEVHACLRRMARQEAAAKKRAEKQAKQSEVDQELPVAEPLQDKACNPITADSNAPGKTAGKRTRAAAGGAAAPAARRTRAKKENSDPKEAAVA